MTEDNEKKGFNKNLNDNKVQNVSYKNVMKVERLNTSIDESNTYIPEENNYGKQEKARSKKRDKDRKKKHNTEIYNTQMNE
jgi:hypothetical protein